MAKAKAEKKHSFVLVEADNWVGLYVDGELVEQHHDIDLVEWLSKYGVNIKSKSAYEDPEIVETGRMPEQLSEVKFD